MSLKFIPRKSSDRGNADHGWLRSYFSFSFAGYQDSRFDSFGALRVINEDRVHPSEGFGAHSHANFEIWSYIISGELEHKDSLGNTEIMKRGDIQSTTAGSGIKHSEYNRNSTEPVHFLQIWALPSLQNVKPQYYNRHFTDEEKRNKFVKVIAPLDSSPEVIDQRNTTGPAPIRGAVTMFASMLAPSTPSISHTLNPKTTKGYIHLIMKSGYRAPNVSASDKFEDGGAKIRLNNGLILEEGDAAFITKGLNEEGKLEVENIGSRDAEFLFFEME